jgi:pimeloyl-ACP methyl ester carboxylesterase
VCIENPGEPFLKTVAGPIVLAGQSYGGAVITNAATGNANVKALVYIDAFIPDKGETIGQLASAKPGSCLGDKPTDVFTFAPFPGAPKGDYMLYIKQSLYPSCFANLVPASESEALAATQRPLASNAFADKSGGPAWKTIPSWSLIGTADKVIPPAEQRVMSMRANAHITEILAPHPSMLTQPGAVATIIMQAAQTTM